VTVYSVELSHRATKQFLALSMDVRGQLAPKIDALAENPRPVNARKLEGLKEAYRLRVGDYRVVYEIREERRQVLIARIAHRRDVYRNL
jgi:mRNA interferase RelE/StbE